MTTERFITLDDITFSSDMTVTLTQSMGGDHSIVAAAKVSINPEEAFQFAQAENAEGNYGLINYLIKHRHGTPFEHNAMTFFVEAPLFVFREWQRHRIASYNEESGRYTTLKPHFWVPEFERKMIPVAGYKAARPKFEYADADQYMATVKTIESATVEAWYAYCSLLDMGIANEVSRAVLPLNIYSHMWTTTNLRGWLNFLSLRTHEPDATFVSYPQWEIDKAARQVEAELERLFPLAMKAWNANGRISV